MTRGWEIVLNLCREARNEIRAGNIAVGCARLDAAQAQISFANLRKEHESFADTIKYLADLAHAKSDTGRPRHATATEEMEAQNARSRRTYTVPPGANETTSTSDTVDSVLAAMQAAMGGGFGNAGVTADDLVDFLNSISGKQKR